MTAPETQTAQDSGSFAAFYAMMLHIDDDDLDPFEYRLLGHYRKICGLFKSQTCTESIETTAKASHMSVAKVRDARKSLEKKGRIKVANNEGHSLNITVVNCMEENLRRYSDPYQKREGYQKRNPSRKHKDTPIKSDSPPLPDPIADIRIEESEEVNTNTSVANAAPDDPTPINVSEVPNSSPEPPILKEVPKEPPGSAPPPLVDKRTMHQRAVDAYYEAIPTEIRPKARSYGGQVGNGIRQLLRHDYTPEQIGVATAEAYRDEFWSTKASGVLPVQTLAQNIEILLRKAKFNGHGVQAEERSEAAPANGVGAGILASDPAKAAAEQQYREHLKRIHERQLSNVPGRALDNKKRAS